MAPERRLPWRSGPPYARPALQLSLQPPPLLASSHFLPSTGQVRSAPVPSAPVPPRWPPGPRGFQRGSRSAQRASARTPTPTPRCRLLLTLALGAFLFQQERMLGRMKKALGRGKALLGAILREVDAPVWPAPALGLPHP